MLDIWAILGGLALDMGLSLVIGLVIGIADGMGMLRQLPDMPEPEAEEDWEELERRREEALRNDTGFQAGLLVISLLVQAVAGYYTAYWADAAPYLNAGVMGLLNIILTHLFDWRKYAPAWFMRTWDALAIPAALFGAWILVG